MTPSLLPPSNPFGHTKQSLHHPLSPTGRGPLSSSNSWAAMLSLSVVAVTSAYVPPPIMASRPPSASANAEWPSPEERGTNPSRGQQPIWPADLPGMDDTKEEVIGYLLSSSTATDNEYLDAEIKAAVESKARELNSLRTQLLAADRWTHVLEETVKSLSKVVDESEARALVSESKVEAATEAEARLAAVIESLEEQVAALQHDANVRSHHLKLFLAQPPLALLAFGLKRDALVFWRLHLLPAARRCTIAAHAMRQRCKEGYQQLSNAIAAISMFLAAQFAAVVAMARLQLSILSNRGAGGFTKDTAPTSKQTVAAHEQQQNVARNMLLWRFTYHNQPTPGGGGTPWQRVSPGVSATGSQSSPGPGTLAGLFSRIFG